MKWISLLLIVFFSFACGHPQPQRSGRLGFLDQYNKDSRKSLRQRKKPEVYSAREDIGSHEVSASSLKVKSWVKDWQWPLEKVEITSVFGKRNDSIHEGLDLRASVGTKVFAVADGEVIYSGSRLKGYGNLVILKHAGGLSSVYAHNSKLYVVRGQKVKQGHKIALSGKSGSAKGPHLHFEVRSGLVAVDPESLLPVRSNSTVAVN